VPLIVTFLCSAEHTEVMGGSILTTKYQLDLSSGLETMSLAAILLPGLQAPVVIEERLVADRIETANEQGDIAAVSTPATPQALEGHNDGVALQHSAAVPWLGHVVALPILWDDCQSPVHL
jgi:hypothetical protein